MIVTTTELQNSFGKYLKLSETEDIIITKNGKRVAVLVPYIEENYHRFEERANFVMCESTAECMYKGTKVSYDEFLKISEASEKRYEYIDGEIFLLASPLYPHQKAVREIFVKFALWFEGKKCEPLDAPFDVTLYKSLDNINVVQPDILVICDKENIDEKGKYNGIPTLVVEVLSESTKRKDLIRKLNLYMATGIKEYWIVNTDSKEVYVYTFNDGDIESMHAYKGNDKLESPTFNGLGIALEQIF
jgi:prevent-host-death family protein